MRSQRTVRSHRAVRAFSLLPAPPVLANAVHAYALDPSNHPSTQRFDSWGIELFVIPHPPACCLLLSLFPLFRSRSLRAPPPDSSTGKSSRERPRARAANHGANQTTARGAGETEITMIAEMTIRLGSTISLVEVKRSMSEIRRRSFEWRGLLTRCSGAESYFGLRVAQGSSGPCHEVVGP